MLHKQRHTIVFVLLFCIIPINALSRTLINQSYILAVDIEAAGVQLSWPTLSVGFCLCTYTPDTNTFTIIEKKRFDIIVNRAEFEPQTLVEFWDKHPAVLTELQKNALPYKQAAQQITDYVTQILHQHPSITIVSDNPAFDIARLNAILDSCGSPVVSQRPDGTYQQSIDVESIEYMLAILLRTQNTPLLQVLGITEAYPATTDHMPENDACVIAWKYVHYCNYLMNRKGI